LLNFPVNFHIFSIFALDILFSLKSNADRMDTSVGIFLSVLAVLIAYFIGNQFVTNLVHVRSFVDEKTYLVRNLPDKQEAADLLAHTKLQLTTLVDQLYRQYPKDKRIILLRKRFRPDEVSEIPENSKYTSYSINKGERIIFCLRSRDEHEQLVSPNTLLFVALHELAHVMTISVGHTDEFWDNFRYLLAHAIHWKLYTPVNFREKPQPYCGTFITDTPLELTDISKYVQYDRASNDETNDAQLFSAPAPKKPRSK
jgi:hypothetical protein